jgi:threonine synthase
LNWEPPDWIVVPGGNLGNSSSFGKAFLELKELDLIDRVPRLAVINAAGANTLTQLYNGQGLRWNDGRTDDAMIDSFFSQMDAENRRASTLATAIEINRPVNLKKCLRALEACNGVVRQVSDQEILDAKAQVGAGGFGCEPASAASVSGAKQLREEGIIAPSDKVVCILTGHQLKDPDATVTYHSSNAGNIDPKLADKGIDAVSFANSPVPVDNDLERILDVIRSL